MSAQQKQSLEQALAALDLPAGADENAVKMAWRKRAKATHPDHNNSLISTDFTDAKEAYEFLSRELAANPITPKRPKANRSWNWMGMIQPKRGRNCRLRLQIPLSTFLHPAPLTIDLPNGKTGRIKLPKAITPGCTVRLKGKGYAGKNGGPAGDVYVTLALRPDPHYRLNGQDIHLTNTTPDTPPAPGANLTLNTPMGPVHITLPKHYKPGQSIRLTGKGLKGEHGKRPGDLLINLPKNEHNGFHALLDQFVSRWAKPARAQG